MNEKTLAVVVPQQQQLARNEDVFMPIMSMEVALARRYAIIEFTKQIMVQDQDFGTIPGTNKPTLLKPGAEKLCNFFGLEPEFTPIIEDADWTGALHNGEMFYYVRYRCRLLRQERVLGVGEGSCNSWESKYRWRQGSRKCPQCGQESIIAGKAEYGGGWLCYKKKSGCGQKFETNDPAITGQVVGRVPNPDVADVVNTIQKMAQKRALVAATLIATSASEFFTQDLDDDDRAQQSPEPPGSREAQNEYLHSRGIGPLPEKPKRAAKTRGGIISFDGLKKWALLKKDCIEVTGNDILYYEAMKVYGYEHADAIATEADATAIWKLIGAGINKARGEKDLEGTLAHCAEVIDARTFADILKRHSCKGIADVMSLAGDPLAALLTELNFFVKEKQGGGGAA